MTPTSPTWTQTLNRLINWHNTNKLAGGVNMPDQRTPRQDQQVGKIYRLLLVVEEEDIQTGDTSELEDYTLVLSPALLDVGAAGREWLRCRELIDFGEVKP